MNEKCQVFTPENYVRELLDSVGYTRDLYGKRILENSCGDGNILAVVVQRYIDDCRANGLSRTKIKNGLSRDIYGVEIDPVHYKKCIQKLNMVLQKNNIKPVQWKVYNENYLRWSEKIDFQYIVGNPPYITYSELDQKERNYVKETFFTCKKGKFDYCYAFIEKSITSLSKEGKMVYLIPSSIFKTVFGMNLRNFMKPYIVEIKDYTKEKVFDTALVKSAIMILVNGRLQPMLHYRDMAIKKQIDIPIEQLEDKWFFSEDGGNGIHRFGEFFKVSHVVATLLNDAYVLKDGTYTEVENGYLCNDHIIERDVVRETATPRSARYNKQEKIIFPYDYKGGKLIRYTSQQFSSLFPGAENYLNDFREQLDEREKDKSSLWFEYGRSQALAGLNRRKLLISTVVTEKVAVYMLKKKCIPYAGMYIVPKSDNKTYKLEDAKEILESDEFMKYVRDVGIHISGVSFRITSKDIEDFKF